MKKDMYLLVSVVLNIVLLGYLFFTRPSSGTPPNTVSERTQTTDKILFIGNSIIARCNWNELLENPNIVNEGVGGITSGEIFMRMDEFLVGNPKKIFFEMGSNDIRTNARLQEIINAFHNCLHTIRIKNPFTKVYFFSVLPVVEHPNADGIRLNDKIDQLNSNIEIFCKRYKAEYVEINSILKDNSGGLAPPYSLDGTHLTPAGYEAIKSKISNCLKD